MAAEERVSKRQKLNENPRGFTTKSNASKTAAREVSPPRRKHARAPERSPAAIATPDVVENHASIACETIASPFQLTRISDFTDEANVDTVTLGDLLGDPMIKECWNFNYLFDLDFVMSKLDPDVRQLCQMHIIHGFWKRDDTNGQHLQEAASHWPNVKSIVAYVPNDYGTHHSKMLILIRHDNCAQVVIHTANMISRDWTNMTQAVWRSPLLPLLAQSGAGLQDDSTQPIGSGARFKADLMRYLRSYESRLRSLTQELERYDFSAVRAAFISSFIGRHSTAGHVGWPGLRKILRTIGVTHDTTQGTNPKSSANLVIQVSSIASLGKYDQWIKNFISTLSRQSQVSGSLGTARRLPTWVIFPTASEIRESLDGYSSGGSIHTGLYDNGSQHQYMLPMLAHWSHGSPASNSRRNAQRSLAAPHIKTYIRFNSAKRDEIDWAMLTSANLSRQAWGHLESKDGTVWIQSYETGVIVWPGLWGEDAEMIPMFGKDVPDLEQAVQEGGDSQCMDSVWYTVPRAGTRVVENVLEDDEDARTATTVDEDPVEDKAYQTSDDPNFGQERLQAQETVPDTDDEGTTEDESDQDEAKPASVPRVSNTISLRPKRALASLDTRAENNATPRVRIGLRMPYDLPLKPYGPHELPWVARDRYDEPDRHGMSWPGYGD